MKLIPLKKLNQNNLSVQFLKNFTYLIIFIVAMSFTDCTSVKEYADSEDGKKMIETAKEKAKDKATQEKVKEIIKEKTK